MRGLITAVCFFVMAAAGAIYVQQTLEKASGEVIAEIDVLSEKTEKGDWNGADRAMEKLEESLEKTSKWLSMFVDHSEIDMIITSFSALKEYEKYKETPELMAETATLRELIGHIPKKEAFSLENIL